MMKRSVLMAAFLSILACFLCSCAGEDAAPSASVSQGDADTARLEAALSAAPEVRELIEIRDLIASRAAAGHVTPEQVREVADDPERANELLGLSGDEASALMGRIDGALASLRAAYPALDGLMGHASQECDACDVERLAATWDRYLAVAGRAASAMPDEAATDAAGEASGAPGGAAGSAGGGSAEPGGGAAYAPEREPLRCKMTQLVIGFGMCAVKSGGSLLFYTICSYAVFCSSCSGGVAAMICP